MGDLVLTDSALTTVITNIVQAATGAAAGALNGAFLGLVTASFVPDRLRKLADLTEAAYTAYARQAITWGPPRFLSDGEWGTVATGTESFTIGAGDTGIVVYGYLIASALTAGNLLGCALFDAPFPLTDSTDLCAVVPRLVLPLGNTWGKAAQLG